MSVLMVVKAILTGGITLIWLKNRLSAQAIVGRPKRSRL